MTVSQYAHFDMPAALCVAHVALLSRPTAGGSVLREVFGTEVAERTTAIVFDALPLNYHFTISHKEYTLRCVTWEPRADHRSLNYPLLPIILLLLSKFAFSPMKSLMPGAPCVVVFNDYRTVKTALHDFSASLTSSTL
jgi:hypothetical protein